MNFIQIAKKVGTYNNNCPVCMNNIERLDDACKVQKLTDDKDFDYFFLTHKLCWENLDPSEAKILADAVFLDQQLKFNN